MFIFIKAYLQRPQICCVLVAEALLELLVLLAPPSQVLGLQMCALVKIAVYLALKILS